MTPSKLLDGSSDFVLTYEDKEGDWMLVGDVPWGYVAIVNTYETYKCIQAQFLEPMKVI